MSLVHVSLSFYFGIGLLLHVVMTCLYVNCLNYMIRFLGRDFSPYIFAKNRALYCPNTIVLGINVFVVIVQVCHFGNIFSNMISSLLALNK